MMKELLKLRWAGAWGDFVIFMDGFFDPRITRMDTDDSLGMGSFDPRITRMDMDGFFGGGFFDPRITWMDADDSLWMGSFDPRITWMDTDGFFGGGCHFHFPYMSDCFSRRTVCWRPSEVVRVRR